MRHALNIKTAGSQITRHENLDFGITEGLHNRLALRRRHLAVQHIDVIALHAQPVAQLLRALLAHAEHNHQIRIQAVNQRSHSLVLILVRRLQANLLNLIHSRLIRIDINQRAVLRQLAAQLAHLLGQRSAAQHRLVHRRRHSNQVQRLIHKALLQHLVHLVQNKILHAAQISVALADMVQQATGRTNQHMAAALQLILLRFKIAATSNSQHLNLAFAKDFLHLRSNLLCQLTRRRDNQSLRIAFARINLLGQRHEEGQRLACARLRAGDNIAACE